MTGWYSSSWWARSLESTNEGSGSGPSLLLYDKILQRRLFAPPAGHPCPASSDKTARPFYDRTARPRQLFPHLEEIDTACRERLEIIEKAMMQQEGVTEALKAADQMAWVRSMNSIHNRAEEIVLAELVYC